jgi:hypothetical protein
VANERTLSPQKHASWLPGDFRGQAVAVCTLVFALAVLLVIVFLFLPVIDQAHVAHAEANITKGDNKIAQLRLAAEKDIETRKLKGSEADERLKKVEPDEKIWKEKKVTEQADLDDLKTSVAARPYWYDWGMMIAFILVVFASLGYLYFGQTTTIRVVGGVVILAVIVVALLKMVWAYRVT